MLRLLIVSGNACAVMPKDEKMRVFSLHEYVTIRDCYGNMLETITKEEIDKAAASDEILKLIGKEAMADDDDSTEKSPKAYDHDNHDTIEIYTIYYRDGNKLHSYQEVNRYTRSGL